MLWTAQTGLHPAQMAYGAQTSDCFNDRPSIGDITHTFVRSAGRLWRAGLALPTALLLGMTLSSGVKADDRMSLPMETVFIEEDQLAVTVASADVDDTDPLDSAYSIWVGEVELDGKDTIWVELIDTYGEVIYGSKVGPNETHLLPDGRAIVVRSVDPETRVAKLDESRLPSEGTMMVTRRVVEDEELGTTSVEFIETSAETDLPEGKASPLMQLAAFGNAVWQNIAALMNGAADKFQVAWNWLVNSLHA